MLKNFECLLLSSEGNMKAREICEEMLKKLTQDVVAEIGFVHVSEGEEARRDTSVVIQTLLATRKKDEEM